jgi:glycosyltransferase involved in cell wall biosynthesis
VTPTVTVVVATFNRRELLEEAVASVAAQTLTRWELLVVDDASDDDTWSWLSSLRDERIRGFRQPVNKERSVARNHGLSAAKGRFVVFLDDDDRLRPRALELLAGAMRTRPAAVGAVGARWKFRPGVFATRIPHPRFPACRTIWPELLAGWSSVSGQNLFRTDVVRRIGGFAPDLTVVEDRKLLLDVAHGGPLVLLPDVVLEYREHDGQRRPDNIRELRRDVYRRFLSALGPADRRRGERACRSGSLADDAGDAYAHGDSLRAARLYLEAMRTSPSLAVSPLTGDLWARGLAKGLVAPVWRPRRLG